jgi:membrane protease YdiL (CAAX protease family)
VTDESLPRWWWLSSSHRPSSRSASFPAEVAIVVLTSALFGAIHDPVQGLGGAEQAMITGLVFGAYFVRTRRIIGVMIAHAAFDVVAVLIIYLDLESYVAHLVFK